MSYKARIAFTLAVMIAVVSLMGSLCQRSVVRDGRRMPAEQAKRMDLKQGDQAFSEGNYARALQAYQRFHSDFPRDKEAPYVLLRIGRCYFHQDDCEAARMYFKEVLKKFPESAEATEAAWGMARCAYKEGDYDSALSYLEKYRPRAKGRRWDDMTMLLARCAEDRDDKLEAVRLYAREIKRGESEDMRREARQNAEDLIKKMDDASRQKLVEEYPSIFPGDFALLQLVRSSFENQDYEEASELLVKFETQYPDSPYYHELVELKETVKRRVHVKPHRIGLLLPLSGKLSRLGEKALQGAIMAAHVFDAGGIKWNPELVIKDTGRDGNSVEALVDELVKEDEVVAIAGPLLKSRAFRAARVAQELSVPYISLSSGEDMVGVGEWVYQNHLTKTEEVKVLLEHSVENLEIKKFGVLYPDIDFGREYLSIFSKEAQKRDAEIVDSTGYNLKTTDFKKEIRSLRKQGIKGLFIPDYHERVAMIAPQVRYYLLSGVTLMGMSSWHRQELLQKTQPEDVENALFTDVMAPEEERPLFKQFQKNFRDQYDHEPAMMEIRAFEAVDVLMHLIENYRVRDRIQLKKALDNVKDLPGVTGTITVDRNGKWRKPVYLFTVMDGEFIVIWQTVVQPEPEVKETTAAAKPPEAEAPDRP
ncbi:MAG: penicillin-binding protein activator [bacterium]